VADAQFDVSDGAFQDEFAELTELRSSANDLAVFAAEREKCRFGTSQLRFRRVAESVSFSGDHRRVLGVTSRWPKSAVKRCVESN